MSKHTAVVHWSRNGAAFREGKYSREHLWTFDGGQTVPASASPANVPLPYSNPARVDPEEAFVASVSSCHMLWFLDLARRQGFQIESYRDAAEGSMSKNERGAFWINRIILRPQAVWIGEKQPTLAEEQNLHHEAHERCFIANSIRTEVVVEIPARQVAAGQEN